MGNIYVYGLVTIYAIEYVGFGRYIPGAQKVPLFLSITIFAFLVFSANIGEALRHRQTKALLFFFGHTTLSITYAFVATYAFRMFEVHLGYIVLFLSTYLAVQNRRHIVLIFSSFIAFHCFLVLENIDRLNASVRVGGFAGGYFLGDGNDFAWSLAIYLPFILCLLKITRGALLKLILIGAGTIFGVGIIGTGSRGAFLAVAASVAYLVLTSPKKKAAIFLSLLLGAGALALAPGSYTGRIQSIGSYDEDSSALGRIMAWKAAIRMSIGDPFGVGAGNFNTAYGRFYKPKEVDPRISASARWISPHSIYFLVLGEYGIIGLITIIILLVSNYLDNQRQVQMYSSRSLLLSTEESLLLPRYLNMSLLAFSVGGAFLGGINYPHIYLLTALIMRVKQMNLEVELSEVNKDAAP